MAWNVYDDNGNKAESMTKEQILAAIVEAVQTHEISDVNTGFVTQLKQSNGNTPLTVWIGTSAQYAQVSPKVKNCLYLITDDEADQNYSAFLSTLNQTLWSGSAQAGNDTYLTVPGIQNYSLVAFLVSDHNIITTSAYWIIAKPYTLPTGVIKYDEVKRSWFMTYGLLAYYGESGNRNKLHLAVLRGSDTDQSIYTAGNNAYLLKIVGIL